MKSRVWIAAGAGIVLAISAAIVTVVDGHARISRVGASPTSQASTTSLPLETSSTTSAAPPLPVPQDAPQDAHANVPVIQIGEIEIPKIGLKHKIYEGVWLTVIDVGPGHWPGTAEPGGYGNAVIAGHRVTHSHPFRRIDELASGDEIIVRTPKGVFTYVFGHTVVVDPAETWIAAQEPGQALTLFACHPPGSAKYRYVVRATLKRSDPPVPIDGMS
ncbi:MAG: class E sortase [Acidimicrobiia bacterium]